MFYGRWFTGILFNPHGKIKRIKIYLDKDGKKKGDALVTYSNAEAVSSSITKVSVC
jgi:RNA recognition motif-containing protein